MLQICEYNKTLAEIFISSLSMRIQIICRYNFFRDISFSFSYMIGGHLKLFPTVTQRRKNDGESAREWSVEIDAI